MVLGVDFDNTLISYDRLFHRVALERSLIPDAIPQNKTAVRDYLRSVNREDEWTRMQGEVYGERILEASPFPGAAAALRAVSAAGIPVRLVSHKTKTPYLGAATDLRAAARRWLTHEGFCGAESACFADDAVYFESTKEEKAQRIVDLGCTAYVDDLPEILAMLPGSIQKILFAPSGAPASSGVAVMRSWAELRSLLGVHGDG